MGLFYKISKKKILKKKLKKNFGKNNLGKIICKHKGGGKNFLYKYIDYWYFNYGLSSNCGYIFEFHYDPNRNSYLALIIFLNGKKLGKKIYFIPPKNLKKKNFLKLNNKKIFNIGYSKQLKDIKLGSYIYNIEFVPYKGAAFVRSPGTFGKIISFIKNKIKIKLPSGKFKLISNICFATLGIVTEFKILKKKFFSAGYNRNLNIRPTVRGVAMNSYDHPHGGGKGRSRVGIKYSKTPWGKKAMGKKTKKI